MTRENKPGKATEVRDGGISIVVADQETILQGLREMGWSEEAIRAFAGGKTIIRNVTHTAIGSMGHDESWKGKDKEDINKLFGK